MNLEGIKVALIFPAYQDSSDIVSLKENKKHIGKIPPLSLAYVAAILEAHKVEVRIIDASVFDMDKEQVVQSLKEFAPDLVGFTLATYHFHNNLSWIKYIKKELGVPIVVGGIQTSIYPEETLLHQAIDYIIIGDAEETLVELIGNIAGQNDIKGVKGIGYRDSLGNVLINESRRPFLNIDATPFPARHLLSNEKYFSLISHKKNFSVMMTSRGCPFNCIFCDNNTIKFRLRSPGNVVDEMEECKHKYAINEIDMFDAAFTVREDRTIEICEEILKRDLELLWSFRTRADLVNKRMLEVLKQASCIRIYYGIESASPRILKNIKKEVDIEKIKDTVMQTKKIGIEPFGFFMIGNIGETKETIEDTVKLIKKLPLKYIQVSSTYAPPNTELYEHIKEKYNRDFWREYTREGNLKGKIPRYGTELSEEEVEEQVRRVYLSFYLNPRRVLEIVSSIRSVEEFKRGLLALKDMLVSFLHRV